MIPRANRRLVLLFLVAVVLPCAVLTVISVRSMRQERELADKRAVEDRSRLTEQARQAFLSRIDQLQSRELARRLGAGHGNVEPPPNSAVRLTSDVVARRIVLPWERGATSSSVEGIDDEGWLRTAERLEFERADPGAASRFLARTLSSRPVGTRAAGLGRLALARTLAKTGRLPESAAEYHTVLSLRSEVVDNQGVPLALYAASRAVSADPVPVVKRLTAMAGYLPHLPPEALLLFREVLDSLAASSVGRTMTVADLHRSVERHIAIAEQATALQQELADLGFVAARRRSGAPRWVLFGQTPWLVSVAADAAADSAAHMTLIALDAREVADSVSGELASVAGRDIRLSLPAVADGAARALSPDLADIGVTVAAVPGGGVSDGRVARSLWIAALALVVGVALFGAYLMWTGIERELRLAEMRSQFVASVSHELKTPLTAVRMFAETLLFERGEDRERRREYLETIVNESERLTRLLNNVLDLAQIERGQKAYHLEPVMLDGVVRRCAAIMEYPLAQQGFRLRFDADEDLPAATADSDALQQAILNLLTNAMKYSGDSRDIDLSLRRDGSDAVLEVRDRGIGIPPGELPRVVEKFYRAADAASARIPGTGLGLTLVDHIVRAHGGRLEIESEVRRGSVFRIRLPLPGSAGVDLGVPA